MLPHIPYTAGQVAPEPDRPGSRPVSSRILQAFPANLDIVRAPVIVNQTTSFARRFTRLPKPFGGGALPRMARLEFARRFGNNRAASRPAP
jgi:hypothetical protein